MLRLLITSLLVLTLGTCVRAQTLPITYEKQFIGYSFKYDNLRLKMPNFHRVTIEDKAAQDVLWGSGALQIGGNLIVGTGTLTFLLANLDPRNNGLPNNNYTRTRNILNAGSLAGIALGCYIIHLADKKRVRAVDIYNQNLPNTPTGYRPFLKPGATPNGVGVLVQF